MPFDRLIDNIKAKNNPTVAGLDPKLSYLPAYLKENAYRNYGKTLEGAAYYEMYGWQGMRTWPRRSSTPRKKGCT